VRRSKSRPSFPFGLLRPRNARAQRCSKPGTQPGLALREDALEAADRLLGGVALIPFDDAILTSSEMLAPATVTTLDAIHLATAVRLATAGLLDTVMTYDHRLTDGAHHGFRILASA